MFKYLFLLILLSFCSSPNTKWVIDMGKNDNPQMQQGPNNFNPDNVDPNYDFYMNKNQTANPGMNQIYANNPNLNAEPTVSKQFLPTQNQTEKDSIAKDEEKSIVEKESKEPKEEKVIPLAKEKKSNKNDSLERIKYSNIEILDEKDIKNQKDNSKNTKIPSGIYIQLGLFSNKSNADSFLNSFKKAFSDIKNIKTTQLNGKNIVLLGAYSNQQLAKKDLAKIKQNSLFRNSFITNR